MKWDIKKIDITDLLSELEEQIIQYEKYKEIIVGEVIGDIKQEIVRRISTMQRRCLNES